MLNYTKIDIAIVTAVIASAVWIGNLQGTLNTLRPEAIKKEKEIAVEEIRKARVYAKNSLNSVSVNHNEVNDKILSRLEQLENSFVKLKSDLNSLTTQNRSLNDNITNTYKKLVSLDSIQDNTIYNRVSALEDAIEDLRKKQNYLDSKFDGFDFPDSKDYLDIKDLAENNRKIINELSISNAKPDSSIKRSCDKSSLTKENKSFRASIDGFSQKGKSVNISISVKNKTNKDIHVSLFRTYALLTSPSGEIQKKSGNRFTVLIKAEDKESFSYAFSFKKDFKGNTFDFTLKFEKPASSFAFFGITNDCF
jgi:hypothetical protein